MQDDHYYARGRKKIKIPIVPTVMVIHTEFLEQICFMGHGCLPHGINVCWIIEGPNLITYNGTEQKE